MYTVICKVQYNGKPFSGFARQPNQLTVQGEIENALNILFRRKIDIVCAGRTDSGVHAISQYISFKIHDAEVNLAQYSLTKIKSALNKLTHDDIVILHVDIINKEFSARFDAKSRKYSYFICNSECPPLFCKDFSWHIPRKLNCEKMQIAAKYLIGEHDFKSFCVASSARLGPTYRNIISLEIGKRIIFNEELIEIKIEGNAFLHSMVRTIVGTLVKVGLGQREILWVRDVIRAKDRQAAGMCAPAKGLVFMDVVY